MKIALILAGLMTGAAWLNVGQGFPIHAAVFVPLTMASSVVGLGLIAAVIWPFVNINSPGEYQEAEPEDEKNVE